MSWLVEVGFMSLGRIVKVGGEFEWVELSETEEVDVLRELISKNIALFDMVRKQVNGYLVKSGLVDWFDDETEITLAVLNAVAIKNFTEMSATLDKKISDLKDGQGK